MAIYPTPVGHDILELLRPRNVHRQHKILKYRTPDNCLKDFTIVGAPRSFHIYL